MPEADDMPAADGVWPDGVWPAGEMPGLTFTGPSQLAWQLVDIPQPAPGQVLVRVEYLGICGTDTHLFTGQSAYVQSGATTYPFRPGHEFTGVVAAIAPGVTEVAVGDRVVGEPFLPCLHCRVCRSGRINLCPNRDELGVRGGTPGAAAQYVRIPEANLAIVPAGVPPEHALLAEPAVTVLHSLDAVGVQPGMRVAIIGSGTIGLLATQVAAHAGAVVDTIGVDAGLQLALEAGASAVLHPDDVPSDTYDAVVEAAGAPSALALAVRIAAVGATISQTGIPGRASEGLQAADLVAKGLTIVGILGGVRYLARAGDLIAAGVLKPAQLIGSIRPWHEADQAMADLQRGGLARPKILLDFRELTPAALATR